VGVWVGNFEGDAMHEVSGVSGAAPAWRRIMAMLHEHESSLPPVPPAGLLRAPVRFEPALEPAREEWFLAGTETGPVVAPAEALRARIVAPPDGAIVALDPDIPAGNQKLRIRAERMPAGSRLLLGDAELAAESWWTPERGAHELRLLAADGTELDRSRFQVRPGAVSTVF
jgi:penicillin-binding protein 1C